jgi:hypothetical protein
MCSLAGGKWWQASGKIARICSMTVNQRAFGGSECFVLCWKHMKTALFTYVLKNIQVFSGIHFVHLYPPFSTIYDMGMSPGRGIFFSVISSSF